ncbi:MAG: TonB-dependent outer membrane protein SusC/RagA [Gemmatimonadetes bacterium]|nr:TonB-dependent outer membrane protein SusC/RagA [Gemmatimonadota bacterium]
MRTPESRADLNVRGASRTRVRPPPRRAARSRHHSLFARGPLADSGDAPVSVSVEGTSLLHASLQFPPVALRPLSASRIARAVSCLGLLLAFAFPATAQAQATGSVTGMVTNEAGQPVAGAQVSIPGQRTGAASGVDGRYVIARVPDGTHTVRVQRLGYNPRTQSVTVVNGQSATANFSLVSAPTTLTSQVIVGYTTQQRRDVSDAVAGVSGDELKDQKVATVEEALHGRIAGVQVQSSGEPGRPAQIIVRGQNFVSGSVSPLYVVDGMYMSENPNLNPDDIESIQVLKDASASAQYGSQAANGVIVISTRRGRNGESRVEARSYYGYQGVPKKLDMMNTAQWQALTLQGYANAGQTPPTGATTASSINTDWQDAVLQSGAIQDHNLSISSGTPTGNYLVSGGFLDQRGSMMNTGFRRYSFRVNSELQRSIFTFGENAALSRSDRQGVPGGRYPMIDVLRMLPTIPVYDANNPGGFGYGNTANPTYGTNPVGQLSAQHNNARSNQVIGTAYADARLPMHLHYRFNAGMNYDDYLSNQFFSVAQIRYLSSVPVATLAENRSGFTSLLFENLVTYDNSFANDAHRINAVVGYTEQRQDLNRLTAYREGFTDENLTTINAGSSSNLNNGGEIIQSALKSSLLRANYSYRSRYLATASVRHDCSSRFSPANRCANFGAGSLGWVVSEEGFYKGVPFLSTAEFFKLRASTGVLGNQDIGDYQFAAPIQSNQNYPFGGAINSGATQTVLANPSIRWQSNRQSDIGVDLGFMQDRMTLTADYYVSQSDGLLVGAPLPWSLGASGTPVVNAGTVRNGGFELGMANHWFTDRSWAFNSSFNVTTTKSRVIKLGNGNQPIYDPNLQVARTSVGQPIGEFFVLQTAGIFQTAADVTGHVTKLANGTTRILQPDAKPGDVIFNDINGDGLINDDDRYNAGNGVPKFSGGLFLDGKLSSFDWGLNFRGATGFKIFSAVKYWTERMDDPANNSRAGLEPWTPTNHSTTTPRAVVGTAGAMNATFRSDRWIESGSFLKIQNLMFGYTIPGRYADRLGLGAQRPRIYMNIQNLHTFTKYSGWDPEILGYGSPLGRGIDDGYIYPNVRSFTFGLDFRL